MSPSFFSVHFTAELLLRMLPMILAAGALSVGAEILKAKIEAGVREKRGETTALRIERLSRALSESTTMIGSIERELHERSRLVQRLRDDCDRYDHLAKLKGTEVEAVVQSFRGELRKEGRRSFWQAVALNFFFFLAGVMVTLYLPHG